MEGDILDQETRAYAVFKEDSFMCIVPHVGKYIDYVKSKYPESKYVPRVSEQEIKKNSIFKIGQYIIEEVSNDILKFSYVLKVLKKTYSEQSSYIPFTSNQMKPDVVVLSTWYLHPVSKEGEESMMVIASTTESVEKKEGANLNGMIEDEIETVQRSDRESSEIAEELESDTDTISDDETPSVSSVEDSFVSNESESDDIIGDVDTHVEPNSGTYYDVPRMLIVGPRNSGKTNIVMNKVDQMIGDGKLDPKNLTVLTTTDAQYYIERYPAARVATKFSIGLFADIMDNWTDGSFRLLIIDDYGKMEYRGIPYAVLTNGAAHNTGFIQIEQVYPNHQGLPSIDFKPLVPNHEGPPFVWFDELYFMREMNEDRCLNNQHVVEQIMERREEDSSIRARIKQFYTLYTANVRRSDDMKYHAVRISRCIDYTCQIKIDFQNFEDLIGEQIQRCQNVTYINSQFKDDLASSGTDIEEEEVTASNISNATDDSTYIGTDVRYLMFSQPQDRVMQNIQIVQNQLEVTELVEEMITFVTADLRAMELYQTVFPRAKVRIFCSNKSSISKAVKMLDEIFEQIKDLYRKSHDSIYRFIVVDMIDEERPLQSMTFESLVASPILEKLIRFAELCNVGFSMNATLPEMRYLQRPPTKIDNQIISGINGVVFSPSYSTFAQNQHDTNNNRTVHYRISMINGLMHDIYRIMTTDERVNVTAFESKICDLSQNESIIFTVPEGRIYKVGVSEETLDRLTHAQDEIQERDALLDSDMDDNEPELPSDSDSDTSFDNAESFIKIEKKDVLDSSSDDDSDGREERIDQLVMVGDNNRGDIRYPGRPTRMVMRR
jgi:hypothetical protein